MSEVLSNRGSITEQIDGHLSERALLVGTPPPQGRDLDLLVTQAGRRRLERALEEEGWLVIGGKCALLRDCSAQVVELLDAQDVGVPPEALPEVFAQAVPLDGCGRVCTPAPHHGLLILARRVGRSRGPLSDKYRRRIAGYLEAAPNAWARAGAEATAWRAELPLAILRQAYLGASSSSVEHARAVAEELQAQGKRSLIATVEAWILTLPHPPRRKGFIVAFSGLDGAGKSTQAQALQEALDLLGYPAEVRWSSLLHYPASLEFLRRTVNRVLVITRRWGRPPPVHSGPLPTHGGVGPTDTAAKRLRMRSPVVAFLWVCLVAARNALEHRRITRPHLSRGRVVICDRYVLDSMVQLRYEFGMHPIRFQSWLVRALSPPADRAFFLEVSPHTASARKDDYRLEENERRARLYEEECRHLDVQRLDGERDPEELFAELVAEVWRALAKRL